MLASSNISTSLEPESVRPGVVLSRRFKRGDQVEVLDDSRNVWLPATVFLSWAEADLTTGARSYSYDVDGADDLGQFHGRFASDHVRAVAVEKSGLDQAGKQSEAKP